MSLDAFLGGRLTVHQPDHGYRAAMEPVLLAASLHPKAGQTVLDVGCGVGVASLCLAARVPDCHITGVDCQPALLALAARNRDANGFANRLTLIEGNILAPPPALKQQRFDYVMANPPFFQAGAAPASPLAGRAIGRTFVEDGGLQKWLKAMLARLAPNGTLAVIHPAASLAAILVTITPTLGSLTVQPIQPFTGHDAALVIVTGKHGGNSPLRLLDGLILHETDARFTPAARAILHDGKALAFALQTG